MWKGREVQFINIDGVVYRRYQKPEYFESVGGIYIGMSQEQVISLYGEPQEKTIKDGRACWHYSKDKFSIEFWGDMVWSVQIPVGSSRHFDRTGFNCTDSFRSYYECYHLRCLPTINDICMIAPGEFLYFQDDSITLCAEP